jgi:hypothetical protein
MKNLPPHPGLHHSIDISENRQINRKSVDIFERVTCGDAIIKHECSSYIICPCAIRKGQMRKGEKDQ